MHKKRVILSFFLCIFLIVLASAPVQAQTTITDELITEFEQIVQDEMEFFSIPGSAIAIIQGDEVVYAQGFGLRDVTNDQPFTTETQFRIGSTTKSMTSLMIAQMVDEGLLSWDTPVTEFFPNFQTADPALAEQVTLADLMGMRTGLESNTFDGLHWRDWTIDDLLNTIASMKIGGDFREFYSYNNEVYALSGYVGLVASGVEPTQTNYSTMIQERVFDPIGMESAIVTDDLAALGDNYSLSYEVSLVSGETVQTVNPPIGLIAPAGAVWTNIKDMAQYVITQMNGGITADGTRIVSEESLSETWQPGVLMESEDESIEDSAYGMGWVTQRYQGVPLRYHDGGWVGYSTQMLILPEDDIALISFANGSFGSLYGTVLNYAFVDLVHDLEPGITEALHDVMDDVNAQFAQAQALISTDVGDFTDYVGTYDDGWSIEQRDDGSVWMSGHGWEFQVGHIALIGQYLLTNNGAAGASIAFETDDSGAVTLVIEVDPENRLSLAKID